MEIGSSPRTDVAKVNGAARDVRALVILRADGIEFFTKDHGSGYRSARDGGTLDYARGFLAHYGYDSFILRDEARPAGNQTGNQTGA